MNTPINKIRNYLTNFLERSSLQSEFEISSSSNLSFGDYSTNIALTAFKNSKKFKSPRELAEKIVKFLNESDEVKESFKKIEVAGAGFINFYLSDKFLFENLKIIDDKFGTSDTGKGKTVIVEYSSPNIAKPFTVGHLRSTIIGDAVANLLEAVGYEVKRDNHLGDWGSQFGKQIYAIKTWGNEEQIEKSENPVKELVALYVKFHEEAEKNPELEDEGRAWFKKLEDGDSEARELWKKCIAWSFKEFDKYYKELGIKFTENDGLGYGESFFEDKMQDVISELREKKLLTKNEGAELVFFPEDKLPPLMITKSDGATLYATRDLATDKFRLKEYGQDIVIINEVGIEQELYFRQLFELEKMLGWVKDGQRIHVKHGHFRFKEGKMSTRKGNVIWLEEVLEEAKKRALKLGTKDQNVRFETESVATKSEDNTPSIKFSEISNNSENVAIGALKWNDLKRNSEQDITFDWDEILNMQGNSGPYIQYAYVRTQSVLSKAEVNGKWQMVDDKLEKEEDELLRYLVQFPYVVEQAGKEFAPNLVCSYLFELSQKFNLFYQKQKIIGSETEGFRINLTQATGQVIKNGLNLLGIDTVDKM